MKATIEFLIEGSFWFLAAFFLYLLLIKKASLKFRRGYLLAMAILPWMLPLIELNIFHINLPIQEFTIDAATVLSENTEQTKQDVSINYLALLYFLGAGLLGARIIGKALNFIRLKRKFQLVEKVSHHPRYTLYHTQGHLPDSSFFNNLFLDNTQQRSPLEDELFRKHELIHISQKHSLDRVLLEILQLMLWFHPLVYLLKRELIVLHEFLADQGSVNEETRKPYQNLLLKQALSTEISFLHTFQSKPMKMRIKELQRKYIPLNPVFLTVAIIALVIFGKSFQSQNRLVEKEAVLENEFTTKEDRLPGINELVFASEVATPLNINEVKKTIGYPKTAREQGIQGQVVVRILVDKEGKVRDFKTVMSESPVLEKAVLPHITELEFSPAAIDGKKASMWVNIPFRFVMLE
ncbi:MAG: M56 family metallopeptidase [Bacteroidia bacterium]|nr:M56 family metallopeptidase [Bacteroidia bacterium]